MRGYYYSLELLLLLLSIPLTLAFTTFHPPRIVSSSISRSSSVIGRFQMAEEDDLASGSFFHKVPEQNDNDDDTRGENKDDSSSENIGNTDGEFDLSLKRAIDIRSTSRAKTESTINGVPTKGFGTKGEVKQKKSVSVNKKSTYVEISDMVSAAAANTSKLSTTPVNDPTKPEIDDQGYTLYTDTQTGKKSRVFEALIEYPCEFKMKIVGANEGAFVSDIIGIVAGCTKTHQSKIKYDTKVNGKWVSVTVMAPVKSSEMLYELYEVIDRDPRVKFKF